MEKKSPRLRKARKLLAVTAGLIVTVGVAGCPEQPIGNPGDPDCGIVCSPRDMTVPDMPFADFGPKD